MAFARNSCLFSFLFGFIIKLIILSISSTNYSLLKAFTLETQLLVLHIHIHTDIIVFNPHSDVQGDAVVLFFTDEETEMQRG